MDQGKIQKNIKLVLIPENKNFYFFKDNQKERQIYRNSIFGSPKI